MNSPARGPPGLSADKGSVSDLLAPAGRTASRSTRHHAGASCPSAAPHTACKPQKGPPARRPSLRGNGRQYQPFTLSFSALAMVIFTTLSASFLIGSPVAGLRTIRAGRSRQ